MAKRKIAVDDEGTEVDVTTHDDLTEQPVTTSAPEQPVTTVAQDVPQPERLGSQRSRQWRAEYHVKSGVQQLLSAKRAGMADAQFEQIAERLLRTAYGV